MPDTPEKAQPACAHGKTHLNADDGIWWCDNCGAPTTGFQQINLSNRGGGPKMGDLRKPPTQQTAEEKARG